MNEADITQLLENVKNGDITISDALLKLKVQPFSDLGYAKVDHHRGIRQGVQEIIYGQSKSPQQIFGIVENMLQTGASNILITRMSPEASNHLKNTLPQESDLFYDPISRIGVVNRQPTPDLRGNIVIASAGTSDMPVAEEAALTAELLGNRVTRIYDVGVAGIHRLLSYSELLMTARVIVVIAGMEGALASVIGGITDCPVIAVPTSIGYGANFNGLSALLSMLNSCASGVSVVNIDNGFGAAYCASMINQMKGWDE